MKFVLFVEGQTEKKALPDFIRRWLDSKLEQRVGVKVVKFEGWQNLVKKSPKKAKMYLAQDDVIGVISLLDLYGPTFYPDDKRSVADRYNWAKGHLEKQVGHTKYKHFFAVHETEAWLLSCPDIFQPDIKNALPDTIKNPEKVDFDEPPAKLLNKIYKSKTGRNYKKVVYGRELFKKLDPDVAYKKCPYLKEFLDELLKMAK